MPEITNEQLTAWMALCDAATDRPWHPEAVLPDEGGTSLIRVVTETGEYDDNCALIEAAPTAMPALIAALREARAGLAELECARRVALAMLEAERAKVKRLRDVLGSFDCCPHCHHARCDNCDDLSARVLKETE